MEEDTNAPPLYFEFLSVEQGPHFHCSFALQNDTLLLPLLNSHLVHFTSLILSYYLQLFFIINFS